MPRRVIRVDGWEIQPIVLRRDGRRRAGFWVLGPGWRRHEFLTLEQLERALGPELFARIRLPPK